MNYVWRGATVEPPRRLGTLMSADSKKALMAGLLVILVMPLDIFTMPTIGAHLAQNPW